jgi:protein-S-isoprenylcysteine O-methyltransferase Ste14
LIAHGTHPSPYRPTAAIVTTGVYRFTRNPIYVAFLLVVLAFGLFANSWWFVVFGGLLFFLLDFGVVKREESYLLEKFGDPYRQYCRQVRRWI